MKSFVFQAASCFLLLIAPSGTLASDWDGRDITDFVTADVSGWQLQCDLRLRDYEDASRCHALFNLDDGNVILDYRADGLRIQTIGKCGLGVKPNAPISLPVADLASKIEATARLPDHKCKPPVLTAELFSGLRQLNTIATILTQKQP